MTAHGRASSPFPFASFHVKESRRSPSPRQTQVSHISGGWDPWRGGGVAVASTRVGALLAQDQAANLWCPLNLRDECSHLPTVPWCPTSCRGIPSRDCLRRAEGGGPSFALLFTCSNLEFCWHKFIWDHLKIKLTVCCLHFPAASPTPFFSRF